jgi:holin-like protein
MKLLGQIAIVFAVCLASLFIAELLPFEFPAGVLGMFVLFALLALRVVRVAHIKEKADFLLANMAFFFVPGGVGIINYFGALKNSIPRIFIICVVTTFITFAVTALSIKLTLRLTQKGKRHE